MVYLPDYLPDCLPVYTNGLPACPCLTACLPACVTTCLSSGSSGSFLYTALFFIRNELTALGRVVSFELN